MNEAGTGIPAVGYLRRSTDRQEASIQEQRWSVDDYASRHGYSICIHLGDGGFYCDDAISGDATDKRDAFQRMIKDGSRGLFRAIIVWDQDRFGRFDPHEASYWTWPLRKAGVQLVTVDRGPVDWSDFVQWLTYSIHQHGKHEFLQSLSRNVLRGQYEGAKIGSWNSKAPYGYRVVGERKHKTLQIESEHKAEIVREIFRKYLAGDSLERIADWLNRIGERPPLSKRWGTSTVKGMLRRAAYTGEYRFNVRSTGKYSRLRDGEIIRGKGTGLNPEDEWIVIPNHHPPIVDRETWEAVQAIFLSREGGRGQRKSDNPLVGILYCGRCEQPLWIDRTDRHGSSYFECSGRRLGKGCAGCSINERKILECLADHVEREWLGKLAFQRFERMLKERRGGGERELREIESRLVRVKRNLGLVEAEFIPDLQRQVRELERERDRLRGRPKLTEGQLREAVKSILDTLHGAVQAVRIGSKEQAREFVEAVERITVHTRKTGKGNGTRYAFVRGEVRFRVDGFAEGEGLCIPFYDGRPGKRPPQTEENGRRYGTAG